MAAGENTIGARERSMSLQLSGGSASVTAADAAAGLAEAQRELAARGSSYGVGFGYVTNFGSPNGLDGIRLEYALTDWERVANVHAIVSGTRLAQLGYPRGIEEPSAHLRAWTLDQLYQTAISVAQAHDRYATLLTLHPLRLG